MCIRDRYGGERTGTFHCEKPDHIAGRKVSAVFGRRSVPGHSRVPESEIVADYRITKVQIALMLAQPAFLLYNRKN